MKRLIFVLLTFFLAAAACQFNITPPNLKTPLPATITPPAAPAGVSTITPGAATQSARSTAPGAPSTSSATLLADPSRGLDGLDRYAQSLRISFEGAQSGKTVVSRTVYTSDVARQPSVRFFRIVSSGSDEPEKDILTGFAGESSFNQPGKNQPCQIQPARGTSAGIDPSRLLPPVGAAADLGVENLNGVPTRHYQLNPTSVGLPAATQTSGDLWLAVEGKYVVKYILRFQITTDFANQNLTGQQTYEYELTKINAKDSPTFPPDCQKLINEFPAMPDAKDVRRSPGLLDFSTSSAPEIVAKFYKDQLLPKGWLVTSTSQDPNSPRLVFTRLDERKTASVSIQREGSKVWVTVQTDKLEVTTGN